MKGHSIEAFPQPTRIGKEWGSVPGSRVFLFLQSISGSDWLNSIAAGDATGELVAAMMPDLSVNPHNVKRPSERRFVGVAAASFGEVAF